MILGDPALAAAQPPHVPSPLTIEDVFRQHARRRPDALALADATNRETFTDGEPRRLTYAETDRMVTAIAGRLRHMALPTDAIVGVQLPNIVENILVMLGIWRAGMIVAPLPLLWRRADTAAVRMHSGRFALRAALLHMRKDRCWSNSARRGCYVPRASKKACRVSCAVRGRDG